jgi:hypothetical protein
MRLRHVIAAPAIAGITLLAAAPLAGAFVIGPSHQTGRLTFDAGNAAGCT